MSTSIAKGKTVYDVVHENLCISCGACKPICPQSAIQYKFERGLFLPTINKAKCIACERCLKICPSHQIDVGALYGNTDFLNNDQKCFTAFSNDRIIRRSGTSGGVVSTIILRLLENKVYEKAYVLKYESFSDKLQAKLTPVTTKGEILGAAKSKYIPASVENVINDIRNKRIGKAIIVATPCQTIPILHAMKQYSISEEDILIIGLFCDKTLNYNVYSFYRKLYGKYSELHFRDKEANGWPSDSLLVYGNKKRRIVSRDIRISLKSYFQPNRCRYCFDKLNQLADISCGDCYIESECSAEGSSSIIVRSKKGQDALDCCKQDLTLKLSDISDIKESQRTDLKLTSVIRNTLNGVFYNFPALSYSDSDKIHCYEKKDLKDMELGGKLFSHGGYSKIKKNIIVKKSHNNLYFKRIKKVINFFKHAIYNPSRKYNILIDHIGFNNRGAQLMLMSIVEQIKLYIPKAQIVVPEYVYYEGISYCHQHHIVPLQYGKSRIKTIRNKYAYQNILNKHTYVVPSDINLILDAGGFQFGDTWVHGESDIHHWTNYYKQFTKPELKVYFLPQAYGPFDNNISKKIISIAHNVATRMYSRDNVSYVHLMKTFPDSQKIFKAPDFTILLKPTESPVVILSPQKYIIIIANSRMIDHSDSSISSSYIPFLVQITQMLINNGENVLFLNHEGIDDELLLQEVDRQLSVEIPIITRISAIDTKSIIGKAKLLISSRFHGVVSGLTQNVPTLCASWSHKYIELLKEHQCADSLLDTTNIESSKVIINDALLNPQKYTSKFGCNQQISTSAVQMWKDIFKQVCNTLDY